MQTVRHCLVPRQRLTIQGRTVTLFRRLAVPLQTDDLDEAYNPNQPRVPRGHGKHVSGTWAARGSGSMVAVLDAHYNEVRPQLDLIAEKYTGQPGQKVEARQDEWTEGERDKFVNDVATKLAEQVFADPDLLDVYQGLFRSGSSLVWSMRDDESARAFDEIERATGVRKGTYGYIADDDSLTQEQAKEKFAKGVDEFLATPAGQILLSRHVFNDRRKDFLSNDPDDRETIARENGVEFPTRTIGEQIGFSQLSEYERAATEDIYIQRTPPNEEAKAAARIDLEIDLEDTYRKGRPRTPELDAEAKVYTSKIIDDPTDNDVKDGLMVRAERFQRFQFNELSDEQKAAALKAVGIDLPVYTRSPTRFRPFNSEPGGDQDKTDYGHSQKIARLVQQERTIAIAAEKGVDITPEQAGEITHKLWGAWKTNSGSPLGLALQVASYEELRSHHRKDAGRDLLAREGFMEIGKLVLGDSIEYEKMARLSEIYQKRKELNLAKNSKPPMAVRADLERQEKELSDETGRIIEEYASRILSAGKAAVTAHVRATWESTQYILDRAGIRDQPIETYRAIIRGMDEIEAGNPTSINTLGLSDAGISDRLRELHDQIRKDPENTTLKDELKRVRRAYESPFTKLPDFKMQRNGAQSTTLDLEGCANTWQGAGGVHLEGPPINDRVVLRIRTPAASALSIPVFGQNVYGEQEIVLTGLAWQKWDAWQDKAPPIAPQSREEVIQSILRQAREKGINKSRNAAENEADLIIGDRGTFTLE